MDVVIHVFKKMFFIPTVAAVVEIDFGVRFIIFVSQLPSFETAFLSTFSFLPTLCKLGEFWTDLLSLTLADLCPGKMADFFSKILDEFFDVIFSFSVFFSRFESGFSHVCPLGELSRIKTTIMPPLERKVLITKSLGIKK